MSASYIPPLDDMRFALLLAEMDDILALAPYVHFTPELIGVILEEAGKFATDILSPLNIRGDRQGCELESGEVTTPFGFPEAYAQFVAGGWNSAPVPESHGGQGLPYAVSALIGEMWHGANMAFGLCPMLTQSCIELIARHGSEEQKILYLPKLVSGEWTGTMCMTEPQAGSDVGAVRTRAVPAGDHYIITGSKIFITFGEHDFSENIIHMVLAKLPDAPAGTKGLSLFLVPKLLPDGARNDVFCTSIEHKMGLNASPTCVLTFGEKTGAIGSLVGQPHQGIQAMFTMMNAARLAVGVEGIGIAGYAYQLARAYAGERRQMGNAIETYPDIERALLTLQAHSEAMRGLACLAGRDMDIARYHTDATTSAVAQGQIDLLIPVIKAHGSQLGFDMASLAMQVFGGIGYIEETGISQLLRDVRVAMIYEGTNGIQALDLVNRKMRLRDGALLQYFMQRLSLLSRQLADSTFSELAPSFADAVKRLEQVNALLKDSTEKTLGQAQLAASPYLRMLGLTAEAYVLCLSALKAAELPQLSLEFRQSKAQLAQFFIWHLLPETSGLAISIQHCFQSA